ncbi:MAG: death-on-curing protein [Patescibacteria group bacterium]|nr:death-on-curing protein [Patescibacteria group bacterium]
MKHSQLILYEADNGKLKIQVKLEDETVWLTLNQIAKLFDRDKSTISKHIKNIFKTGELNPKSVVAKIATTDGGLDSKT